MTDTNDLVVVYAGTLIDAQLTKTFLEAEGIAAFLTDELVGAIAPWQSAPGGAGAVKVMVRERDRDEAQALLASTIDETETPVGK